jgi:hypothetical protein
VNCHSGRRWSPPLAALAGVAHAFDQYRLPCELVQSAESRSPTLTNGSVSAYGGSAHASGMFAELQSNTARQCPPLANLTFGTKLRRKVD